MNELMNELINVSMMDDLINGQNHKIPEYMNELMNVTIMNAPIIILIKTLIQVDRLSAHERKQEHITNMYHQGVYGTFCAYINPVIRVLYYLRNMFLG